MVSSQKLPSYLICEDRVILKIEDVHRHTAAEQVSKQIWLSAHFGVITECLTRVRSVLWWGWSRMPSRFPLAKAQWHIGPDGLPSFSRKLFIISSCSKRALTFQSADYKLKPDR